MALVSDYTNLITSEHQDKPNFVATVSLLVGVGVQIQNVLASLVAEYDVDTAIGAQLDVVGQWVGLSRNVQVPITGVYFSWNDTAADGWNFGVWKGPFDPSSGVTTLPDDVYRQILKGRIAANHWDGTTEGAYAVWAVAFPNTPIVIQDNENMSMFVGISGAPLDSLTKALIIGGYIPLKPEGVHVSYIFTTVDAPLFGWNIQNDYIQGWGTGAWGEEG